MKKELAKTDNPEIAGNIVASKELLEIYQNTLWYKDPNKVIPDGRYTGVRHADFSFTVRQNIFMFRPMNKNKHKNIKLNLHEVSEQTVMMYLMHETGWNFGCLSFNDLSDILGHGDFSEDTKLFILSHSNFDKFTSEQKVSLLRIELVKKAVLGQFYAINLNLFSPIQVEDLIASLKGEKELNFDDFSNSQKLEILRIIDFSKNHHLLAGETDSQETFVISSDQNLQQQDYSENLGVTVVKTIRDHNHGVPLLDMINKLHLSGINLEQKITVLKVLVKDLPSLQAAQKAGLDLSDINKLDSKALSILVSELDKPILQLLINNCGLDISKIIGYNDVALVTRSSKNDPEKLSFLLEHDFASVQHEFQTAAESDLDGKIVDKPTTLLEKISGFLSDFIISLKPPIKSIPKKMHYVWLTNADNPRELFSKYDYISNLPYKCVFDNKVKLYGDWEHTLWINDKSLIPNTVEVMTAMGINVKELKDLKTHRSQLVEKLSQFQQPKSSLLEKSSIGNVFQQMRLSFDGDQHIKTSGGFIDTTKYLIVESEGGMVADLNYHFMHKLSDEELSKDTFIAPFNKYTNSHLPYLLAATQHNKILKVALNRIEEAFKNGCKDKVDHNECATSVLFSHYDSVVKEMLNSDEYKDSYGKVDSKVSSGERLEYDYWLGGALFGMDGFEKSWESA